MADSPLRMVETIGNRKIVTKSKNTSGSGLASVGPEIVVDRTRLFKELKLVESLVSAP
jgi:hypothetical protein